MVSRFLILALLNGQPRGISSNLSSCLLISRRWSSQPVVSRTLYIAISRNSCRFVAPSSQRTANLPSRIQFNLSSPPLDLMGHSKSVPRSSSQTSGFRNGFSKTAQKPQMVQKAPQVVATPLPPSSVPTGPLPLSGKVFAITGGASGIGLATAQVLSRRGATVCIADVDPEAMKSAEVYFSSLEVPHMITRVDVSKRKEVDAWIESIVKGHGRLDGAANVAGVIGKYHGVSPVSELDDDEWDRIIGVNLTGTMYCMRAELRNMVDRGSIVNVSSIHGLKGFARHGAYDASKHGIVGLTRAAALENGEREIRVNSVAPGAIYTPLMQKNWDFSGRQKDAAFDDPTAFQRQGTAEETANVIAFLLGPESTFVSGSVYKVDGAWI